MTPAQRVAMVLVGMVAFVGLWLLAAPFYGPPGTLSDTLTAEAVRVGTRDLCSPPLYARLAGGVGDVDRRMCQTVGIGRWETGWMLLCAAGFGWAAAARLFRPPDAPKRRWRH